MNNSIGIGNNRRRLTTPSSVEPGSAGQASSGRGFFNVLLRTVRARGTIIAGLVGLGLAGCESVNPGPQPTVLPVESSRTVTSPVVLAEGDVVRLSFPGAAEFNNTQKIRLDGRLSLPVLGEVQAAGKTLARLQSELSARYKPELLNSEVVVTLDASGPPVIVSGAIASPGKFLFDRPTTLLEAIMGAGGFTDYAKKRQVRLIRIVNGQYETHIYDMSQGLRGGRTPVVYVKGGDIIHVPQSNW